MCDLPEATEVMARAVTYWRGNEFDSLAAYTGDLERKYPGYIPAVLLRCFHSVVYKGELESARETLGRIADYVKPQPAYSEFAFRLAREIRNLDSEIQMHNEKGHDVRAATSPRAVKEAIDRSLPPAVAAEYLPLILDLLEVVPERFLGDPTPDFRVTIVRPAEGATLVQGQQVSVQVAATSSAAQVCQIDLYVGSNKDGTAPSSPARFDWSGGAKGSQVLKAAARDQRGNRAAATVTVNVK